MAFSRLRAYSSDMPSYGMHMSTMLSSTSPVVNMESVPDMAIFINAYRKLPGAGVQRQQLARARGPRVPTPRPSPPPPPLLLLLPASKCALGSSPVAPPATPETEREVAAMAGGCDSPTFSLEVAYSRKMTARKRLTMKKPPKTTIRMK